MARKFRTALLFFLLVGGILFFPVFRTSAKPQFIKQGFEATYTLRPKLVINQTVVDPNNPDDIGFNGWVGKGGNYSWQVESVVGSTASVRVDLNLDVLDLDLTTRHWLNNTGYISVDVDSRQATAYNGTGLGAINYWIDPGVDAGNTVTIYGKPPYEIDAEVHNFPYNPVQTPAGSFDCWWVMLNTRLDVPELSNVLFLFYDKATGMLVAATGWYYDVVTMLMGIKAIQVLGDIGPAQGPVSFVLESQGTSPMRPNMGDLNGDGLVNILDIAIAARAFRSTPESPNWNVIADVNRDGIVNIVDVAAIASNFGLRVL